MILNLHKETVVNDERLKELKRMTRIISKSTEKSEIFCYYGWLESAYGAHKKTKDMDSLEGRCSNQYSQGSMNAIEYVIITEYLKIEKEA